MTARDRSGHSVQLQWATAAQWAAARQLTRCLHAWQCRHQLGHAITAVARAHARQRQLMAVRQAWSCQAQARAQADTSPHQAQSRIALCRSASTASCQFCASCCHACGGAACCSPRRSAHSPAHCAVQQAPGGQHGGACSFTCRTPCKARPLVRTPRLRQAGAARHPCGPASSRGKQERGAAARTSATAAHALACSPVRVPCWPEQLSTLPPHAGAARPGKHAAGCRHHARLHGGICKRQRQHHSPEKLVAQTPAGARQGCE